VFVDNSGASHPFGNAPPLFCQGDSFTSAATDNSGYILHGVVADLGNGSGRQAYCQLYDSAGNILGNGEDNVVLPLCGSSPAVITDTNGAQIRVGCGCGSSGNPPPPNFAVYDDTFGFTNSTASVKETIPNSLPPYNITHQFTGPDGAQTATVTLSSTPESFPQMPYWPGNQAVTPAWDCAVPLLPLVWNQSAYNPGTVSPVGTGGQSPTNVTLPDGSQFNITYENTSGSSTTFTGRAASLGLPTGGTISYSYSGGTNSTGINCTDGTYATVTRTTPDGIWTYTHTPPSGTILQVAMVQLTGGPSGVYVPAAGYLSHKPFSVGQQVTFVGVGQATFLNGQSWTINAVSSVGGLPNVPNPSITGWYDIVLANPNKLVYTGAESQGYIVSGDTTSTTTVQDPAGNQTVYKLSGPFQTEKLVYNGAVSPTNLLLTQITCYNLTYTNPQQLC
jgi:hypothetical protein